MGHHDVPERWVKTLATHLRERHGHERTGLSAADFSATQTVKITFQDGSFAFFRYAFYLVDRELMEVAVFTEHCGYHIYPLFGTRLERLELKLAEDETE